MRKSILMLITCAALALPSVHQAKSFDSIATDAAKIQRDAEELSNNLKAKTVDEAKVKADITALGDDIIKLRKDVETIDASASSFNEVQKKDWELVKTKVQLLNIFYDRKAELMSQDFRKHRSLLRAHAKGIAKRAAMLQQTASRL